MKNKIITILLIMISIIVISIASLKSVQAVEDSNNISLNSEKEQKEEDEAAGGIFLKPIAQFLCFVPDSLIGLLQNMFVTEDGLQNGDGTYSIKYSPGIIFSGQVPAFDINFIDSDTKETTIANYDSYVEQVLANNLENATSTSNTKYLDAQKQSNAQYIEQNGTYGKDNACYWVDSESETLYIECCYSYPTSSSGYLGSNVGKRYYSTSVSINDSDVKAAYTEKPVESKYKSSAVVLQKAIATWYNVLRTIALVGLLSVLVYIGIRIVLTSTSAKDKAKYKNMLKDWLIAFCILFALHYIMSIIVIIVDNVNEILYTSTMGINGEDLLMTTLRNNIADADNNWNSVIVQVVLYFILTVFTIIFTIQYLRRTIYLAFLTMIAPLITLTYPLDKIKDNKSQAFDMWIKDYIFFSLLQVVHLLIYYILVGSAIDLVNEGNWIYSIVAIGFLIPAEKIIKKMFGFEKSKTMGALAAGATGALVMNAINKISRKRRRKKKRCISRNK